MLKYYLIELKRPPVHLNHIITSTFECWREVWNYELGLHGEKAHVEDFARSDILAVIVDHINLTQYHIVAFHLYTGWNLNYIYNTEHPYFKEMPNDTVQNIAKESTSTMSMEYLTVTKKYRKKESGIAFAEVIINLGMMVMNNSPWASIIGTSRVDRKVNKMGEKIGCASLNTIKKYDYECIINYVRKDNWKLPPDFHTRKIVIDLWGSKENYTSLIQNNSILKAA